MSLQVDEGGRRGRSRSPSGRRADEARDRSRGRTPANVVEASPYPTGASDDFPSAGAGADAYHQYERLSQWGNPADDDFYRREPPRERPVEDRGDRGDPYADSRRDSDYRYKKDRERDSDRDSDREKERARAAMFLPQKYAANIMTAEPSGSPRDSRNSIINSIRDSRDSLLGRDKDRDSDKERERARRKEKLQDDLAYGKMPGPSKYDAPEAPPSPSYAYAQPKPYEYAKPDDYARYGSNLDPLGPGGPRPGGRSPSPSPASPIKSAMKRASSPQPPVGRMSNLTVNTGHGHSASLSLSSAPPSPLLEAYHGTYQSMSPMPSPLLMPTSAQVLEALSPIGSEDERAGDKKRSRRARFHDPVDDAARLAKALKGEKRAPETEPLIEILPGMTHEQIMELRTEYKRLVKTGTERKGVNIAKHIRARLKDEDPNLMKACYATALGRWESEAYWANFWYHGDKTRRELLIESLMGRTNEEISKIKDGFNDKKYANSLTKCMKQELKEDKFKKAVLMVLEQQRMEETDGYGRPLRLDYDQVEADVRRLRDAVLSDKGGESAMIQIVIMRSDSHLREVMKVYKNAYKGANFAKDALKKSGNLVGELLAHILNGVINKPFRDAMLLHHALTASRRDELRRELLISRLVRFHWDGAHMVQVKNAFREQYGRDLQDAVREATSGEWGEFCRALCITRMPDHVKRVERVDIHRR
ncbi:hypothetical protein QBC35DRAFT_201907 [Podospora australis]|uniref:Annexin n=1 Tax=Podospora australis TaxID=1536484 RepID=A0AAN7APC9_9PEZI|nr:hypothetical protein QBC35DRAFT_201907 [Podospora australis]